ncbi:MAG: thrombospondin type 3 repeat-containing protein [Deltaproteobacteria bacterium]|nr:thrombospondin type 3 repeat-containing protein [Deltaproteobacteria bacterium]MBW2495973.1 thrombospondin type 3 repeat-containing protein [Deltaproteobacteria bacterium]
MAPDGATSWGRNVVESGVGNEIYARFEINGLAVEGGLSSGDSGGAWFIRDGLGLLRIAAISFAMTGPYQADAGGAPDGLPFEAPLFDIGGLWVGNPGSEVFIDENPVPIPAALFGTRVSKRLDWIGLIVGFSPEDTDGDGVPNDQDNCPYRANADQLDAAGLGFSSPPDGIGDVCQCGDVTGEGQVNDTDATFIRRQALGLSAPLFLVPGNCDVTGEGLCNGTDATLIRHAAAGNVSALFGQNCPNALP